MKQLFSHFTAPVLAAVSMLLVAGCSSDNSSAGNTAGTNSGGSSSGGNPASSGGGVSVGGAGTGGGGAGSATAGSGNAGGPAASYAEVQAIILRSCFGAICHDLAENPLKLKPVETMYSTLTTHVTANCGKLVNTTSPADSALVKILQGSCGTAPNITERMPYQTCSDGDTPEESAGCVPTADVATIQAWIAKGATQQ